MIYFLIWRSVFCCILRHKRGGEFIGKNDSESRRWSPSNSVSVSDVDARQWWKSYALHSGDPSTDGNRTWNHDAPHYAPQRCPPSTWSWCGCPMWASARVPLLHSGRTILSAGTAALDRRGTFLQVYHWAKKQGSSLVWRMCQMPICSIERFASLERQSLRMRRGSALLTLFTKRSIPSTRFRFTILTSKWRCRSTGDRITLFKRWTRISRRTQRYRCTGICCKTIHCNSVSV